MCLWVTLLARCKFHFYFFFLFSSSSGTAHKSTIFRLDSMPCSYWIWGKTIVLNCALWTHSISSCTSAFHTCWNGPSQSYLAVIGCSLNRRYHSTGTTLVSTPKLLYSCHSVPLHLSCQSTLWTTETYSVNLLPVAIAVSHEHYVLKKRNSDVSSRRMRYNNSLPTYIYQSGVVGWVYYNRMMK